MNKVFLTGYLGKDPEIKTAENGTQRASFTLATNTHLKDKVLTQWHYVVGFGNVVKAIEHLKKGSFVLVEGSINYHQYKNKENIDVTSTQIMIERLEFLDKKPSDTNKVEQTETNNDLVDEVQF